MANANIPPRGVMNLTEAAHYIRVSEKTLGEMARQQRIPSQKVGREWRFLREALENWLQGGARDPSISASSVPSPRREVITSSKQLALFEESGFRDTAFTQNRNEPFHRWVPWIAGFSASFVAGVFDALIPSPPSPVLVLDPFAGVGTTLMEGLKRGYNVAGFEINPYAALACRLKLTSFRFDLSSWKERIRAFEKYMTKAISGSGAPSNSPPPGFKSRVPFFSPAVERQVLLVMDFISRQREEWIREAFKLALGAVMVGFSNYSYEPSLGRREAAGKKDVLDADVKSILASKLREMEDDAALLKEIMTGFEHEPKISMHQQSYIDPHNPLPVRSIDILITSPPYLNNYHYVRNTRPQLYWLGLAGSSRDLNALEDSSFGKFWQTVRSGPEVELRLKSKKLSDLLKQLRILNQERGAYGGGGWANYAAVYFNDCDRFFEVTKRVMKKNGAVVVVIGNNILQGIEFKTDQIFAEIAEQHGFKVIDMHRVRTKRTGSSIVNSSVRIGEKNHRVELYESAVELRAP